MSGPGKKVSPSQIDHPIAAPMSRRRLFPTLLGFAVVAATALSRGSETAEAQSKTDKKTAKYQDHPNKGQQCAICKYFQPPKSCQLVEGDISPNGWCSFFAKKT
jgi:hypothetical protein